MTISDIQILKKEKKEKVDHSSFKFPKMVTMTTEI